MSTPIADCRVSPLATPGRRTTQLERIVELEAVVRVQAAELEALRDRIAFIKKLMAAAIEGAEVELPPPPM